MEITTTDLGLAARVQHLKKTYGSGEGTVRALDDVSVGIRRGQFTAIMGPSGSGKSTLMHIMAGLDSPTEGRAWIGDTEITGLGDIDLTILRRRRVGFIFQAFNLVPTLDALGNIMLPFELDGRRPSAIERARIDGLVETLGLGSRLAHRPHQLSGGQQQRVAIARALAMEPAVLLCDEITSALDVSVQGSVLNLVRELRGELDLTMLFISHNLSVVRHVADSVGVMYLGRLVELSPRRQLFSAPRHPYTRMLLDAIPDIAMTGRQRTPVQGEVPNPLNPPSGCAFHPRCPHANARCSSERPELADFQGIRIAGRRRGAASDWRRISV